MRIIAVTKAGERKLARAREIVEEVQEGLLAELPAREREAFVSALEPAGQRPAGRPGALLPAAAPQGPAVLGPKSRTRSVFSGSFRTGRSGTVGGMSPATLLSPTEAATDNRRWIAARACSASAC